MRAEAQGCACASVACYASGVQGLALRAAASRTQSQALDVALVHEDDGVPGRASEVAAVDRAREQRACKILETGGLVKF